MSLLWDLKEDDGFNPELQSVSKYIMKCEVTF